MEFMPAKENKVVLHDWFFAHIDAKNEMRLPKRSTEVGHFIDYLWPSGLDYFSPLNPMFIAEITNPALMTRHPVWLARDGLIPLLWFFKTNPEPKSFKGVLWVNKTLSGWVPEAWRKVTGTYQLESLPTAQSSLNLKKRKLLLLGLVSINYCTLSHLEKQLKEVKRLLKRSQSSLSEVLAFLPPKSDHFGEGFYGEFCRRLFSELGTNIHFLSWQEFNEMKSFKGYEVLELNEGFLCSDNFAFHHALSRGASIFSQNKLKASASNENFLQTSPYHGVRVERIINGPVLVNSKVGELKLGEAMLSSANHRFPWPSWFESWNKLERPDLKNSDKQRD